MSSQNGDNFSYSITYHTFPEQYEESIPRFSFTLRKHQTEALAWLIQRETNPPGGGNMRGGILADDMGLGKTIELLSLIVLDKVQPQTFEKKWDFQHLTHQGYCPDRTLLQQIQPSMGFGSTSTSSSVFCDSDFISHLSFLGSATLTPLLMHFHGVQGH
ncbi:hypothetical protein BLNAU_512 [Blattamonas nauphoetae]|uniref:SNF2 N-terminal domain-containing protein n=1 Tax=Blattamonas nauphoetae TaxID=2049346 RepID=A0ABQ9YLR7_9EUKA|nr:hypothetical protein BLNAU_512 [Blattamonas nauphoetae]